jgi:four helix bundle protein
MNVALREARETHYWLRIVEASKLVDSSRSSPLLKEAVEIMNILGAIVSSARGKRKS